MMAYDNYYNDFFNHDYTLLVHIIVIFNYLQKWDFGRCYICICYFISFFKTVVYTKHIMMVKKII